jgi:hypothetical protein
MVDKAVQNSCVYHSNILLYIPISVYSRFRIQHPQVQQAFDKIENVTRIHRDNYESFQVRKGREREREGERERE